MASLPRLFAITDWSRPDLREKIEDLLKLGSEVAIQHRDPGAPIRVFLERARWLKERCDASGTPLFINGRLDIALLLGAHLHLPEAGPTPEDTRRHLSPRQLISAAVHQDLARAKGADLAFVSPVFHPGSKRYAGPLLGPQGFFELAKRLPCPAYALGGVTEETAPKLQGAAGVAAVSSLFAAQLPSDAARRILDRVFPPPQPSGARSST